MQIMNANGRVIAEEPFDLSSDERALDKANELARHNQLPVRVLDHDRDLIFTGTPDQCPASPSPVRTSPGEIENLEGIFFYSGYIVHRAIISAVQDERRRLGVSLDGPIPPMPEFPPREG